MGSFENRPHSQLRSSQNPTPGGRCPGNVGGSSFRHWVYLTGGVLGLEAGPREDGHAAVKCAGGDGDDEGGSTALLSRTGDRLHVPSLTSQPRATVTVSR